MTTTNHSIPRTIALAASTVVLALSVVACGNSDKTDGNADKPASTPSTTSNASDAPVVSDVWARTGMAGGNTAIYMVIDGGSSADELVGVKGPDGLGASVEMHETVPADGASDNGMGGDAGNGDEQGDHGAMGTDTTMPAHGGGSKMMTMRPVESIAVPAGGRVALEPGGYHIMVMELTKDLVAGDEIPVTLTFKNAGEIDVTAEVREP